MGHKFITNLGNFQENVRYIAKPKDIPWVLQKDICIRNKKICTTYGLALAPIDSFITWKKDERTGLYHYSFIEDGDEKYNSVDERCYKIGNIFRWEIFKWDAPIPDFISKDIIIKNEGDRSIDILNTRTLQYHNVKIRNKSRYIWVKALNGDVKIINISAEGIKNYYFCTEKG